MGYLINQIWRSMTLKYDPWLYGANTHGYEMQTVLLDTFQCCVKIMTPPPPVSLANLVSITVKMTFKQFTEQQQQ